MRLDKGTIFTAVLAVVLWFALVPQDHEPNSGEPRVAAYWWIMLGTAAVLGFVLGRQTRPLDVAVALAGPQVVAALFTAPRGDNDGLRVSCGSRSSWVLEDCSSFRPRWGSASDAGLAVLEVPNPDGSGAEW